MVGARGVVVPTGVGEGVTVFHTHWWSFSETLMLPYTVMVAAPASALAIAVERDVTAVAAAAVGVIRYGDSADHPALFSHFTCEFKPHYLPLVKLT